MGVTSLPVGIAEALGRGATVVTGNQRAARTLRRAVDRRNREAGLASWRVPAIMAWDGWLTGFWRELVLGGGATELLMNRTQEHLVWRAVLEGDTELASLKGVDSLAKLAAEAWALVCGYSGLGRLRGAAGGSSDAKAFVRWVAIFERRCREDGLLSGAQLAGRLLEAVAAAELKMTGEVVLVGFDVMTPAQRGLVEAVAAAGAVVTEVAVGVLAAERVLVRAADEAEELRAAAGWARGVLETDADARIAVIVPGLEAERREIDRVFREVLAPEMEAIGAKGAIPYEYSVGMALGRTPMVATALELLRWAVEARPLEEVSGLMLSPYLAMVTSERGARAELEAFALRGARLLRPEVSVAGVMEKLGEGVPVLAEALRRMMVVVARSVSEDEGRLYSEWAEVMHELLDAARWGAGMGEDSVEYQTRRRWEGVLDELATLDFAGARVSYKLARRAVERIAEATMFAPASREAPVQVMGPYEAAGGVFDAVWFLRAGDLTWPTLVSGSPLLPWGLQKELGLPGVDAGRDSEMARRVTDRVARSAPAVVFSYAAESDEGRQRASAGLDVLELEAVSAEEFVPPARERVVVALEAVADDVAVGALPAGSAYGGSRVLELQAACAFRAFAELRMGSAELGGVTLGLDAGESGAIVHRVMEEFWGAVKTQAALRAMPLPEREVALDKAIGKGLERVAELCASSWDAAYVTMQRERLRRLLGPWLEKELARPPFTVKQREQSAQAVQIGPLTLDIRLDRVDETEGGELVIDYKTGMAATRDWLSPRPDAPQLPLYAVVADSETLGGVAYGQLRVGKEMGWKFFARNDQVLGEVKGMETDFASQVEAWRERLTVLAEEFAAGTATVSPKEYPATCKHCGQRLLCRVVGSSLELVEEDSAVDVE